MQIIVTDKNKHKHEISFIEGDLVKDLIEEILVFDNVDFALCGGCCCCATCHVYTEGKYPPMNTEEKLVLNAEGEGVKDNSRLSCQLTLEANNDGDEFIIV
jgi:ferredoxin|tara:strand:+ start:608 stop:910 length:303 start_codon:yes stop_codon:yes gene_type:complete